MGNAQKSRRGIDMPLDELLEKVQNKYELVIFASKRARQINDYYSDASNGDSFDNCGPLVHATLEDKPLSVALEEINLGKIRMYPQPPEGDLVLDDK